MTKDHHPRKAANRRKSTGSADGPGAAGSGDGRARKPAATSGEGGDHKTAGSAMDLSGDGADDVPAGQQAWIPMLNLNQYDKGVLAAQSMLTDSHMWAAAELIRRLRPDMGGLQDTTNAQTAVGFEFINTPGLQFHHNAALHWLMSTNLAAGQVQVFDSAYTAPNNSVCRQLHECWAHPDRGHQIPVHYPPVQRQKGAVDCGLFAIAWAFDLALGSAAAAVAARNFDQTRMRAHLAWCFETLEVVAFPEMPAVAPAARRTGTGTKHYAVARGNFKSAASAKEAAEKAAEHADLMPLFKTSRSGRAGKPTFKALAEATRK